MSETIHTSSRYNILSEDSGGSSIIYKAQDKKLNTLVAIKAPSPSVANNPNKLNRFVEEAKTLARIRHDNVISVLHFYEAGELDKHCMLVTEWMDKSLADVMKNETLSPTASMQILHKICSGVFAIHQRDIIHRDIKPENVFLSNDATEVKIGDLGIASDIGVEQTTLTITPKYTAPENYYQDKVVGRQSDIYSLGMIAYEMLLGESLFKKAFEGIYSVDSEKVRSNRWTHWHMNLDASAPPLSQLKSDIPAELSDIVARMMMKDTSRRYLDISEVLSDLQGIVGNSVSFVAPLSLDDLEEETKGSSGWGWFGTPIGITVCVAVLILTVVAILFFPRTPGIPVAQVQARFDSIDALRQAALDAGATDTLQSYSEGQRYYSSALTLFGNKKHKETLEQLAASEPLYQQAYDDAMYARIADLEAVLEELTKQTVAKSVSLNDSNLLKSGELHRRGLELKRQENLSSSVTALDEAIATLRLAIATSPRSFVYGSSRIEIAAAYQTCLEYQQGCQMVWYEDELSRSADVKPFQIDMKETTNGEFAAFVEATRFKTDAETRGFSHQVVGFGVVQKSGLNWRQPLGAGSNYQDHIDAPVIHVSARDAAAYCKWSGKRLPIEAEWEYATRGLEHSIYSWGNEWNDSMVAWGQNNDAGLAPVGSHSQSATAEGIQDLTGSVWEWTGTTSSDHSLQIAKGGSRLDANPANLRAAARRGEQTEYSSDDIGIRCARDIESWDGDESH